jgi:hypothetical protein
VSELPPGHLWLGRYEVVKALEKGSGGSVYLVNDLFLIKSYRSKEQQAQCDLKDFDELINTGDNQQAQ